MTTFSTNASWPNVTIPDFDIHGSHLRILTQVLSVSFAPIVTQGDRPGWEAYALLNAQPDSNVRPTIFSIQDGEVESVIGPGPFVPLWEMYPMDGIHVSGSDTTAVNFDLLSDTTIADQVLVVEYVRKGALSGFLFNASSRLISAGETESYPISSFLQPIFKAHTTTNSSVPIVGFLQGFLDWRVLLSSALHEHEFVHVALWNSCNQTSSWEVSGNQATFEGGEYLHPIAYEDLKVSFPVSPVADEAATSSQERSLSYGSCGYVLNVYPTTQLRESYDSNFAAVYTSVVAAVFFLMAITFFLYDRFVHRRNQKILRTAARSSAIVSSMFPTNIRDRILRDGDEKRKKFGLTHAKAGLKTFLHDGLLNDNCEGDNDDDGDNIFVASAKPIADLFPETTIMFADLAGFTAWSSTREPSQVFTLLETVYHAFDVIARKRRVFKVRVKQRPVCA